MILHDKIEALLPEWRERVTKLVKEKGDVVVGEVNVGQIYGGIRGVKALVTDISYVDPNEGIRLRGHTVPDTLKRLPKPAGAEMPYVGGLYYLLMTGEFPTEEEAKAVEAEWSKEANVPKHVFDMLRTMPEETHPMALFSQAVLALQSTSKFAKQYAEGLSKMDLWKPALDDAMALTAKLGVIAAFIYRMKYKDGAEPKYDPNLDYGANFARMMGVENKEYEDLARLYFILHSDHESGNVSAHAMHLVGSTLADAYYAFSAAMNGLAGPLHGLANQNCLAFLMDVQKKFNGAPDAKQMNEFTWETLNSGQVVPGYGHAVLRVPDPRYTAQFEFAKAHFPDDELFKVALVMKEVVPPALQEQGKAKNPWPNVDAISGTLQYHYGITEFDFYTVLFGVGRALGVTANYVWARALGQPIERPKSLTTKMLEDVVAQAS
jgi:citrate synthase